MLARAAEINSQMHFLHAAIISSREGHCSVTKNDFKLKKKGRSFRRKMQKQKICWEKEEIKIKGIPGGKLLQRRVSTHREGEWGSWATVDLCWWILIYIHRYNISIPNEVTFVHLILPVSIGWSKYKPGYKKKFQLPLDIQGSTFILFFIIILLCRVNMPRVDVHGCNYFIFRNNIFALFSIWDPKTTLVPLSKTKIFLQNYHWSKWIPYHP